MARWDFLIARQQRYAFLNELLEILRVGGSVGSAGSSCIPGSTSSFSPAMPRMLAAHDWLEFDLHVSKSVSCDMLSRLDM